MLQQELLGKVIDVLQKHQIEYMVTGSIASSLQGEPRSTHDIDLVVNIHSQDVEVLVSAFSPPRFYLDPHMVLNAIARQEMFNLIDTEQGDKIDFWLLTSEPFDQSRFSRRYKEEFRGLTFYISRPEDTILAKLQWAKLSGGSTKQLQDVLGVYEVQSNALDMQYIETWVIQLELSDYWEQIKAQSDAGN